MESMIHTVALISGGSLVAIFAIVAIVKQFLHVGPPNHILVLSGGSQRAADGSRVGFRIQCGGRRFRKPIVEKADYMDVSLISVPMGVSGAYSKGGIPLTLHAIANVKIATDPRYVGNAVERFLGQGTDEIRRVAKETLEGHLRGVLATMTPEEVNEDRLKFAETLTDEAEEDLQKLGLHLDTLKIQHVADDTEYLANLGRAVYAEVEKTAKNAESDAERQARESEAQCRARGDVAMKNAQAEVLRAGNQLDKIRAELEARARSEEERAKAAADAARAQAEQGLQRIRGRLEELRLSADVTIPADIDRRVRQLQAAGAAAPIAENGKAMAEALGTIAEAWKETEGKAMDMYVLQNIDQIFGEVAKAAGKLKVREVNLVDGGDGKTLPAYMGAYPATVGKLLGEIRQSLGIDIAGMISGVKSNNTPA